MTLGQDLLYLCDADVRATGLGLAEVEAAVEAVLAAKAAGRAVMKPKLSLHGDSGALFLASAGILDAPAMSGVKWVGVADAVASGRLTAPMPGRIAAVLVEPGAVVARGAPLIVLEAMKMEHSITAPADGRVERVNYAAGDLVEEGAVLVAFGVEGED